MWVISLYLGSMWYAYSTPYTDVTVRGLTLAQCEEVRMTLTELSKGQGQTIRVGPCLFTVWEKR